MNIAGKIIISLVMLLLIFVPIVSAQAQFMSNCNYGDDTLQECIENNTIAAGGFFGDPRTNLPEFIGNVLKFLLTLVGSIFLLLIIYAGIQWMTAGGNTDQVKKASQTIRNSVIGLIIIVLSYAVTITVFDVILSATQGI